MLLPTRRWIGKKVFGESQFGIRVSPKTIIKDCELSEIGAMEYVAKYTTIPIPRIIKIHKSGDNLYMELERIEGRNLHSLWLNGKVNESQKNSILDEVAGYIRQLQDLSPPQEDFVGSALGNACVDYLVSMHPFGPFESHDLFHTFRRHYVPIKDCTKFFNEEVTNVHSRKYKSVFTHAHLKPRSIYVNKKMKVVAIADWKFAGWYPEYWEFTKVHFTPINMSDWYELLDNRMTQYKEELDAERCLWRRLDIYHPNPPSANPFLS